MGENAEITKESGAVFLYCFSSFTHDVCMESESFPTGMVIPILLQKSTEMASTVSYRSCLSLSVMIEDIQFAESFISVISPMGAERIFVIASPTAILPEAAAL